MLFLLLKTPLVRTVLVRITNDFLVPWSEKPLFPPQYNESAAVSKCTFGRTYKVIYVSSDRWSGIESTLRVLGVSVFQFCPTTVFYGTEAFPFLKDDCFYASP